MPRKQLLRITVDIAMAALLPLLMTYSLLGEAVHEWLGAAMLLLLIVHHIWNAEWYRRLFQGRHTLYRGAQSLLTGLLITGVLGSMVSGALLSQYVFDIPTPQQIRDLARLIHLTCAYWSLTLASIHLGLHWGMIMGAARTLRKAPLSPPAARAFRGGGALIAAYSVWAFFQNDFPDYLLLRTHFVFWSDAQALGSVLIDYLAVMGALTFLGYYAGKALRSTGRHSAGNTAAHR